VYACGASSDLPQLAARVAAVQALLPILSQLKVSKSGKDAIRQGLLPDTIAVLEPPVKSAKQVRYIFPCGNRV
jgi:hypothetical protein